MDMDENGKTKLGGRASGNTCLGKAGNNMLRPNSESHGGQDQITHNQGRPEHVIGPYLV